MTAKWWVVCDEYAGGPHGSREIAERKAKTYNEGAFCELEHRVEQHDRKPQTERDKALDMLDSIERQQEGRSR